MDYVLWAPGAVLETVLRMQTGRGLAELSG